MKFDDDGEEGQRRSRRRTSRRPDVDAFDMEEGASVSADPEPEVLRAVVMVPDSHWGFSAVGREDHPGLCVRVQARQVTMLKGSSSASGSRYAHVAVAPSPENGLTRLTRFSLEPRHLRAPQVRLYFPERHVGYLEPGRFQTILEELARLFPSE